jgi:hypothetical protein
VSETHGVEADESPQLDKLAAALAKAQAAVAHADPSRTAKITKDGTAKRKYATLADVMDAGRPALAANGLAVVQHPSGGEGGLVLTSWLLHESGQWMRSRLSVPYAASQAMSETQALGSAITYCRRYAYAAICGVAVEDDDAESTKSAEDGQGNTTEAVPLPTTFPPFGKGQGQPIAGAQVSELEWYAARMREGIVDPEKARFKGKNEAMLKAIEAELARQRGATPEGKRETKAGPSTPFDRLAALAKAHKVPTPRVAEWLKGNGFPNWDKAQAGVKDDMVIAFERFAMDFGRAVAAELGDGAREPGDEDPAEMMNPEEGAKG